MAYLKVLKDSQDNIIYPQTVTSGVFSSKGENLDTTLQRYVSADNAEAIEEIENNYENIANKTTTINVASTDIEYPTAKAVYDYGLSLASLGINIVIVNELPSTAAAELKTIYLVPKESGEENNIYEEYLLVEIKGVKKFEKIGDTSVNVDLTDYATKTYVDESVPNLDKYATKTYVDDSIAKLPTGTSVQTLTREEYNELTTYNPNTFYVIE